MSTQTLLGEILASYAAGLEAGRLSLGHASILLTSNRDRSEWAELFGELLLASARDARRTPCTLSIAATE